MLLHIAKSGKPVPANIIDKVIADAAPDLNFDSVSAADFDESLIDTTANTNIGNSERSPDQKYKLYQKTRNTDSTRSSADHAVFEYKKYADDHGRLIKDQETILEFKQHLQRNGSADNTISKKLSHLKTFLKQAHGFDVYVKGKKQSAVVRNPHYAYPEADILQLVDLLETRG